MKLLFDQQLSPRLVARLQDLFQESVHVSEVGLDTATDDEVWKYARDNDLAIASKDRDFNDLAILRGFPPKVIWLQIGNCTTGQIELLLRAHQQAISEFEADTSAGVLVLS